MLQYVAVAAIFSIGWPWKLPTWRNCECDEGRGGGGREGVAAPPPPNTRADVFTAWLAVVLAVSLLLCVRPDPALYGFLSLQRLPQEWHLTVLAWAWASFAAYFALVGAVFLARRRGMCRWGVWPAAGAQVSGRTRGRRGCTCGVRCGTRPVAAHKVARRAWRKQFGLGGSGGPAGGAAASPVVVVTSPLARALGGSAHKTLAAS
jgi:hypothetical protein